MTFMLSACLDNKKLVGERVDVINQLGSSESLVPINVPSMVESRSWGISLEQGQSANYFLSENPEQVWSYNLNSKRIVVTPVVIDGKIIVLDEAGKLQCIDLMTGQTVWDFSVLPLNEPKISLFGGGLVPDSLGNLYIATSAGEIISFSTKSNSLNWRLKADAPFLAAPVLVGDSLFVTDTSNVTISISLDGTLNWSLKGSSYNHIRAKTGRPEVLGRLLLIPRVSGDLLAVDKETGAEEWYAKFNFTREGHTQNTFGPFDGQPLVSEGRIYFGSLKGKFLALDNQGKKLWEVNIGLQGSPLLISDSIFFVSDTNYLVRINKADGSIIWSKKLGEKNELETFFSPVLLGSKLWISSTNGKLVSFDVLKGDVADEFSFSSGLGGPPVHNLRSLILYTSSSELIGLE
tara:strand:+ start:5824 stop:7038 length:1215 start_codon:yes stop_codon:yes gene_type:complete